MKNVKTFFLMILIAPILSGCGLFKFSPETGMMDRVTIASANQIFPAGFEGFTDEQLLLLLNPDYNLSEKKEQEFSTLSESGKIKQLRVAFRKANTAYNIAHRSQIQDRLIAASNQRCNLYATYLKRVSTIQNAFFRNRGQTTV